MVELIKFELEKIFNNKIIFVTVAVLAIFMIGSSVKNKNMYQDAIGTREEVRAMAEDYMTNYSDNDMKEASSIMREKYKNGDELSGKENLLFMQRYSFFRADEIQNKKDDKIKDVNTRIDKLKENNEADSFQYKNLLKEKEMLEALHEGEDIFCGDWSTLLNFILEGDMKIIIISVGLASIFSKEYSKKVSYINLSSKNGRSKLSTAKMIAAFIYATIAFIIVTIIFAISTLYLGIPNGDKPISYMIDSVYNISINQYFLYTLALSYLGTLIFTILIVILSLFTKNIILAFGIPLLLHYIFMSFKLPDWTRYFNFSKLMGSRDILKNYESINVFGNVVMYPYVITFVAIVAMLVLLLIYNRLGKKQTIV